MSSIELTKIPRGNTVGGTNREIIKYLLSSGKDFVGKYFFDIPCGSGDFLRAVKNFFPQSVTVGGDLHAPPTDFPHKFLKIDAQREFAPETQKKFDVITCISGVMEFDNTLSFFERLRENLNENGLLIVTNDNLLSVRDRFLYLLFGRYRQYRLFISNESPTWKTISLQNLIRLLYDSGFEIIEIKFVPPKLNEWIWLPLVLPLYITQMLYLLFAEKGISFSEKLKLYPFESLLARHYFIVCRGKT